MCGGGIAGHGYEADVGLRLLHGLRNAWVRSARVGTAVTIQIQAILWPLSDTCTFLSNDSVNLINEMEYLAHTTDSIIDEHEETANKT